MSDKPDLSIIIVSYNTRDMLRDAISAVPAAMGPFTFDIWVVDNHSTDGSGDMVRNEFPAVTLIENPNNPGFAAANNQAIAMCSGRFVLLLNPDTEAEPYSLAKLVEYCGHHPDVGAIGPMLLNTDGSLQINGGNFPSPIREILHYSGIQRLLPNKAMERYRFGRTDFDVTTEVDQVSGACIMVPSEVITKVGPLDDGFFMFFEEVEWCWRIKKAGYRVVYLAESRVVHHWMGSVRSNYRAMERELNRSRRRYYRKTGGLVTRFGAAISSTVAAARAEFFTIGSRVKRAIRKASTTAGKENR